MSNNRIVSEEVFKKLSECKTQTESIKTHLESFGNITPKEAMDDYGIYRLSAIIYNLRHDGGMNIKTVDTTIKNRYGNSCTYATYTLSKVGHCSKCGKNHKFTDKSNRFILAGISVTWVCKHCKETNVEKSK